MEAIRRYDADKTGLPDYALEPAGKTSLLFDRKKGRCDRSFTGLEGQKVDDWSLAVWLVTLLLIDGPSPCPSLIREEE